WGIGRGPSCAPRGDASESVGVQECLAGFCAGPFARLAQSNSLDRAGLHARTRLVMASPLGRGPIPMVTPGPFQAARVPAHQAPANAALAAGSAHWKGAIRGRIVAGGAMAGPHG